MTTEKAIEELKVITFFSAPEFNEAINKAIESLEKQIPKKPDYEGDGYDDNGNLIYDTWICPNCEHEYEIDYEEHSYCPECGQAIDRSK